MSTDTITEATGRAKKIAALATEEGFDVTVNRDTSFEFVTIVDPTSEFTPIVARWYLTDTGTAGQFGWANYDGRNGLATTASKLGEVTQLIERRSPLKRRQAEAAQQAAATAQVDAEVAFARTPLSPLHGRITERLDLLLNRPPLTNTDSLDGQIEKITEAYHRGLCERAAKMIGRYNAAFGRCYTAADAIVVVCVDEQDRLLSEVVRFDNRSTSLTSNLRVDAENVARADFLREFSPLSGRAWILRADDDQSKAERAAALAVLV